MSDVLLIGIMGDQGAQAMHLMGVADVDTPVLHLMTRTPYDDTVTAIRILPSADLKTTVDLIVMAVEHSGKPNKRLLILHDLPEAYWHVLRIELMRNIRNISIEPMLLEVVDL